MAAGSLFHDWEMGTQHTKNPRFYFLFLGVCLAWWETEEDSFVFVVCGTPWRHLDKIVPFFFIPNEKNVLWTFIFAAFFFLKKLYYDT